MVAYHKVSNDQANAGERVEMCRREEVEEGVDVTGQRGRLTDNYACPRVEKKARGEEEGKE